MITLTQPMKDAIQSQWDQHCKRSSDLWVEPIAQAERLAKMIEVKYFEESIPGALWKWTFHFGGFNLELAEMVQWFLGSDYTVEQEYTEEHKSWNTYLTVTNQTN